MGAKNMGELATMLGYDTVADMLNTFAEKMEDMNEAVQDVDIAGMPADLMSNMTVATAKSMQKILTNLENGPLGTQGADEFKNGLDVMLAGLSDKDKKTALTSIANIDWTAYDAAE